MAANFAVMAKNFALLFDNYMPSFMLGLYKTLQLSAMTVFFGAIIGSLICLLKMSRFAPFRWIATAYIEIIRGTPLLLQLYFFYFLVPLVLPALELSKFSSISFALVLNSAGYVAEIVRAGIQAVDKGQTEAARSLGMNSNMAMWRIVMPQAIKNILPAIANEFVTIIKESSICSVLGMQDIMFNAKLVQGASFLPAEPLIIAAALYFLLTFPTSKLIQHFERRMRRGDVR